MTVASSPFCWFFQAIVCQICDQHAYFFCMGWHILWLVTILWNRCFSLIFGTIQVNFKHFNLKLFSRISDGYNRFCTILKWKLHFDSSENTSNHLRPHFKLDKPLILGVFFKKMYRFRCLKISHLVYFKHQNLKSRPRNWNVSTGTSRAPPPLPREALFSQLTPPIASEGGDHSLSILTQNASKKWIAFVWVSFDLLPIGNWASNSLEVFSIQLENVTFEFEAFTVCKPSPLSWHFFFSLKIVHPGIV